VSDAPAVLASNGLDVVGDFSAFALFGGTIEKEPSTITYISGSWNPTVFGNDIVVAVGDFRAFGSTTLEWVNVRLGATRGRWSVIADTYWPVLNASFDGLYGVSYQFDILENLSASSRLAIHSSKEFRLDTKVKADVWGTNPFVRVVISEDSNVSFGTSYTF